MILWLVSMFCCFAAGYETAMFIADPGATLYLLFVIAHLLLGSVAGYAAMEELKNNLQRSGNV
jgi:hypothetical protein